MDPRILRGQKGIKTAGRDLEICKSKAEPTSNVLSNQILVSFWHRLNRCYENQRLKIAKTMLKKNRSGRPTLSDLRVCYTAVTKLWCWGKNG
jgi:hypothetical protein